MATEALPVEAPFLHQIHSPLSETPNIDFVFVHGLNPMGHEDHAFRTWTHVSKTGKTLWPREFLPQDFPKARIWIFGYNSNVSKGVSEATISDHANSLLDVLQCERHAGREHSKIPIIFLGHSLGGLVIKQALLNAKGNPYFNPIWEAAVGLVFFGTPHRGGNAGGAAALAARIAKLWANDSAENNLLMCLKPDSLFTQESSERFSEQLDKYHILTFIETIPMEFHGFRKIVVKRHSAVLNVPREKVVVMNRDHRGLCKFADKRYPYFIVHSKLEEMVAEVLRSSGNSTSPSATPVIPTSTPTSASITQQTGDRTLSLDTNEELSDTAQNPRESYDAIVSQSSSEESVNHDAPLEPRRGLHPEAQTEGIRLSSTTALNHVDPRTTSRERITRDDSPSSSQNYVSPAFRSSLNDQFLQAVKRLDTPIIYNWINDPNRRPWLKSEHVQSALLGLAGLHTGQDPRFRTLAVSVILDKCAPDLECTDAAYKATPLILAASGGRTEIVALLIEKEARLQATDGNFGRTALTWAARNNALGTAKVLLEALAGTHDRKIIHARDKDGLTALDLASQRNHQRMGNLLVSYGAIRVREES